jgi:retron-type reverse transcriptase
MSFWDKLKGFFAGAPATPGAIVGSPAMRAKVEASVLSRTRARQVFLTLDIASETCGSVADIQEAMRILDDLFARRIFEPLGYTRSPGPHGHWVYHPRGVDPSIASTGPAVRPPPSPTPKQPTGSPVASGSAPVGQRLEDFQNPTMLGLTDEELRQRSAKRDPRSATWVGRTDAIPPATDERMAGIDRNLVMRGLLSPQDVADIHQVGEQWSKLRETAALLGARGAKNANAALEQLRLERAQRKAEKKRLAAERAARRAAEVARRRAEDIVYLGPGVSGGLADRKSDLEALQKVGLPVLSSPADVALVLGLPLSKLRWLCFHSEAAERIHYVFFEVKKRSGGMRLLSAPHQTLAGAQQWILRSILDKLPTEESAHGFVKGRSTVTNAAPHLKRDLVVNLDLKDFFPSVGFARVRAVFHRLGYSPAVATVLALLCTECPRRKVEYDGRAWWVAVGPRGLPQGACTSPAISNQVSRKLDRRLKGMAHKHGWTYTRYADDLTFSAPKSNEAGVAMLLARVRHIAVDEGFAMQEKKGRVQRASGRQTVTGIVVNERPSLPREEIRALRAILHNARKTGLAAQNKEHRPHFEAWLRGKLAYLCMIDRARGSAMLRELDVLKTGAGPA